MKKLTNDFEELSEKIDELIFWVKYSTWKSFKMDLKVALRDDVDKLVYELSDGKRSTRDIADEISKTGRKITHTTVANMWQKWALSSLVIPAGRSGRYRKVASLKAVEIQFPTNESKLLGQE